MKRIRARPEMREIMMTTAAPAQAAAPEIIRIMA